MTTRRITVASLIVVGVLTACASGSGTARSPGTAARSTTTVAVAPSSTTTTVPPDPRRARLRLTPVARITSPTAMAVRGTDPGSTIGRALGTTDPPSDTALYVTEQSGRVRAIRHGRLDPTPVLDLRDTVSTGGERGLLGLTFSPDGSTLYVDYTNRDGDTRVDAYTMRADGTADRASRRELLAIAQPQANHNGGNVMIGPDGMLWVGTGDGGAANDTGPGHAPQGNGQSLDTLLGKLLRIDPTPSAGRPYGIPADNPFARGGGRPEIYAYGLRNPWRFSFDPVGRAIVIGDVGQNAYEEVDWTPLSTPAPWNYGWPKREGTHRFRSDDTTGLIEPVLDYPHDGRCAISGGYVYRGRAIPDLVGTYLYSDACDGTVRGTLVGPGSTPAEIDFGVRAPAIVAFGQDTEGELYVLSQGDGVLKITS